MIPTGFAGVEAQLWLWLVAMIRPGAMFVAAPIFGAAFVPLQVRFILALALGIPALSATSFVLPAEGLVSFEGVALVAGEVMVGLAIGFAVQIGFSAALVAGELIGNAMGLGFAAMVDPATGQQNPALSQFLSIMGTFLFLSIGGHLALAATVVESYQALPPGQAWISAESLGGLVRFGGVLFAAGLSIALPVAFAIVLVQLVMGMLSRTAPQLNLFAVGFPAALLAGMVLLAIAAPMIGEGIIGALQLGLEEARRIATAS
ncbi:flagellar biosynthetic protein FliR [Sphingosinicella terrae]|uniref:flagellar biosynthetic protein FliR n=1 Tax=Sphingosinicella terrae TaxID=2172047 RepID=UPI000E0DF9E5|nr:flagellar biosynthetic protein FliR [Sphingosinicella terrae]